MDKALGDCVQKIIRLKNGFDPSNTNEAITTSISLVEMINEYSATKLSCSPDIVVIGEQSIGKSTLCNSITRKLVLCTEFGIATKLRTRVSSKYNKEITDGSVKCTMIKRKDNEEETILDNGPLKSLFEEYSRISKNTELDNRYMIDISISSNKPRLGMSIIDNPGLTLDEGKKMTQECSQHSIDKYLTKNSSLGSLIICNKVDRDAETQISNILSMENVTCDVHMVFSFMDNVNIDRIAAFFVNTEIYKSRSTGTTFSIADILYEWGKSQAKPLKIKNENKIKYSFVALSSFPMPKTFEFDHDAYLMKFDKSAEENTNEMYRKLLEISKWKDINVRDDKKEDLEKYSKINFGIEKFFSSLLESSFNNTLRTINNFICTISNKKDHINETIKNVREDRVVKQVNTFITKFSNYYINENKCVSARDGTAERFSEKYDFLKNSMKCSIQHEEHICEKYRIGVDFEPGTAESFIKKIENVGSSEGCTIASLLVKFRSQYAYRIGSALDKEEKVDNIVDAPVGNNFNIPNINELISDTADKRVSKIQKNISDFVSSRVALYFLMYAQLIYRAYSETENCDEILEKSIEGDDSIISRIKDIKPPEDNAEIYRDIRIETVTLSTIKNKFCKIERTNIKTDIIDSIVCTFYWCIRESVKDDMAKQCNPSQKSQQPYDIMLSEFASAFIHSDQELLKSYVLPNSEISKSWFTEEYVVISKEMKEEFNVSDTTDITYTDATDEPPESTGNRNKRLFKSAMYKGKKIALDPNSSTNALVGSAADAATAIANIVLPGSSALVAPLMSLGGQLVRALARMIPDAPGMTNTINTDYSIYRSNVLYNLINIGACPDVLHIPERRDKLSEIEVKWCNYVLKRRVTASVFTIFTSTLSVVNKREYEYQNQQGVNFIIYNITSRFTSLLLGYGHPYAFLERPRDYKNPMEVIPILHAYKDVLFSEPSDTLVPESYKELSKSHLFVGICRKQKNSACRIIDSLYRRWKDIKNERESKRNDQENLEKYAIKLDNEIIELMLPLVYKPDKENLEKCHEDLKAIDECKNLVSDILKYMYNNKVDILKQEQ